MAPSPDDQSGPTLNAADLPSLFHAADETSIRSRASFFGVAKAQVALLLAGVISGTVAASTDIQQVALVGVASFIGVAALRVYSRLSSLEASWYDARLAAESVKSLAWRYSVGGAPFGKSDMSAKEGEQLFNKRLWELLSEASRLHAPPGRDAHYQITPAMRELRDADLEHRKAAYERERVADQASWYAQRARGNDRQARFWDGMFVLASAVAILFGLLQAIGAIGINVLGIAGFAAALITMWTGMHRYDRQGRAYAVSAHELLAMESMARTIDSEEEWCAFVDDAEAGVSEEHTSWRVSRARA